MQIDKDLQEQTMYENIKFGLMVFKNMAKKNVARRWADLSKAERMRSARSLVEMEHVAKNPSDYFAREKTEAQWKARAAEYVKEKNIKPADAYAAYYIVQSPETLVENKAAGAFIYNGDMFQSYCRLCKEIFNWEYCRASEDKSKRACAGIHAKDINEQIIRLRAINKIEEKSRFVRPLYGLLQSLKVNKK